MPIFNVTLAANVPMRLLKKNPMRKIYFLKNDSTSNIYIGHDNRVAASGVLQGLLLEMGGAVWKDEYWKGDVWCLCAAAVSISVIEDTTGDLNE